MGDLLIVQNQIIQHWNLLLSLIICCTKFILYARPNFCKLCELKETHHLSKLFGMEIYHVSKILSSCRHREILMNPTVHPSIFHLRLNFARKAHKICFKLELFKIS